MKMSVLRYTSSEAPCPLPVLVVIHMYTHTQSAGRQATMQHTRTTRPSTTVHTSKQTGPLHVCYCTHEEDQSLMVSVTMSECTQLI